MADELYLSCWLRGFTEHNMLRHWERLLLRFPFSRLAERPSTLYIHAIDYTQPTIAEEVFPAPLDPAVVLTAAREHLNGDCLFRLETWWDLLQVDPSLVEKEWKLRPAPVALSCFGPAFENELGDQLRIEFGLDSHYLPQTELPNALRIARSNLQGVMRLVHDLDDTLPLVKRQLWLESGDNFAERLEEVLAEEG